MKNCQTWSKFFPRHRGRLLGASAYLQQQNAGISFDRDDFNVDSILQAQLPILRTSLSIFNQTPLPFDVLVLGPILK